MKLREDGFVMAMAYPDVLERPTGKVNLCPLFWRFMFMTFVARPFMVLIVCPLLNLMGFLMASFYAVPSWKECNVEGMDYKNWPCVRGMRIIPAVVLIGLGLVYLFVSAFVLLTASASATVWMLFGVIFLFVALLSGVLYLWNNKAARETRSLVGAFISAKYQKVCPVVELVKK